MLSPDELINEIDAQHLIVTRLREMIGVSAVFNERYWPLLQRVAKWLYDIPLSKKTHSEPGGALRHAIEAGFIARSMAESMVFASDAPSEARRELEAQYQYISFVSAVCSVLHKPSLEIEVVAEDTFVKNKKVDAKCDLALSELVRNAHMLLSKRISIRHGKAHVAWLPFEEALQDFLDRHDGSVPEVIEEVSPGELEADMASLLLASRIMPIASAKRICCEFFPKACRQCE